MEVKAAMAAIDPLETLSNAIDGIESRYEVHGSFALDGLTLTCGDASVTLPQTRGAQDAALAPLLAVAEASPFGHGGETKIDDKVRVARHITADRLQGVEDLLCDSVLAKITTELVPDSKGVRAVLHKLNFYGPGGHFAKHRDTPRAESQFGSLVVSLPAAFEGGQLLVSHEGDRTTCDWGRVHSKDHRRDYWSPYGKSDAEKKARADGVRPREMAHWIAYFADAEHEVRPVTAGMRMTLTYELHRDEAPDPNADALLVRAESVRAAFAAVLADATCEPGKLAYECRHLYEEKALTSAEKALAKADGAKVSVRTHAKALKNEDAVVAVAARAAGLDVEFLRVVEDGYGYSTRRAVDKLPSKAKFGVTRYVENRAEIKVLPLFDGVEVHITHLTG